MRTVSTRKRLVILTACSVASGMVFSTRVWAQAAPAPVISPAPAAGTANPATPQAQTQSIQAIKVFYKKLLLKEKNVANAISVITPDQIKAVEHTGSIQSVLAQTPSVNEYQSGVGQKLPVITVRGVRASQLADTLDGVPINDLLYGGAGGFLTNNNGAPVTLGQINSSTIYPGIAPPDRAGFATVGGTIAYTTKIPSKERSAKIFGSYGSFDTYNYGFEINTGKLSKSPDAPRFLLRYNQGYSAGYQAGTNNQYEDLMASAIKPYDYGLSRLTATVIYNRDRGYDTNAPIPVPLMANNFYFNFPKSITYLRQNDKYLTAILGDRTYVNSHLILSAHVFFLRNSDVFTSHLNPNYVTFNPAFPYQTTFQVPYLAYLNIGPGQFFGNTIPNIFSYNPIATFGSYTAGEDSEKNFSINKTVGFTPRANIFLPHNVITIGGLFAKETSGGPGNASFIYGADPMPQILGYNSFGYPAGGLQRTVMSVYLQDKIDLLNDKLHIQPGITIQGVYSSNKVAFTTAGNSGTTLPGYKLKNFGRVAEPYIGVSYDLPHHMVAYASYGKGARFAPVGDYVNTTVGTIGTTKAPNPEIVHSYEAGLRYDTNKLYLNADIYYQKITSSFSFLVNYQTGQNVYDNIGSQQFRGEEASVKYNVNNHISVFGNFSHNQSTYLNSFFAQDTPFEGQYGFVFKGDPLAGAPNFFGNFGISYKDGPFDGRLSGHYTGQQFITADIPAAIAGVTSPAIDPQSTAIAPAGFPNVPLALATVPYYPSPQLNLAEKLSGYPPVQYFKLPGYLLMNLYLSYKYKVHFHDVKYIKISLNAQNLLGLKYYQHYFLAPAQIPTGGGGYATTPQYASAYQGPPRSITVGVSAKF